MGTSWYSSVKSDSLDWALKSFVEKTSLSFGRSKVKIHWPIGRETIFGIGAS